VARACCCEGSEHGAPAGALVRGSEPHQRILREEYEYLRSQTAAFSGVAAVTSPLRIPAQEKLGTDTEIVQAQAVSATIFRSSALMPQLAERSCRKRMAHRGLIRWQY